MDRTAILEEEVKTNLSTTTCNRISDESTGPQQAPDTKNKAWHCMTRDAFPRLDEAVRVVYPVPPEDLPGLGEDHSVETLAIWNRKGGVAKTTVTHAIGFALALKGKRVLMVDASPQCDLSFLLLQEWVREKQQEEDTNDGIIDYNLFFGHKDGPQRRANNLRTALSPVIHHAGGSDSLAEWAPADVTKIQLPRDCEGALFLLPGHEDVHAYEQKVTVAYGTHLQVEAAAPGAWNKLMTMTARKCGADIVLVDCNPHAGMLNMHIILTSDYLLLPCTADVHCHNAIGGLPAILEGWVTTRHNARNTATHAGLAPDVQIPDGKPQILGISVMRSSHIRSQPSINFEYWINRIEAKLLEVSKVIHALPALEGMAGTRGEPKTWPSILTQVPDFCEFAALSHYSGLPVFALGPRFMCLWDKETGIMRPLGGKRKDAMDTRIATFQGVFQEFLENICSKIVSGPFLVAFDAGDGDHNDSDKNGDHDDDHDNNSDGDGNKNGDGKTNEST